MNGMEETLAILLLLGAAALYWASAVNARDRARGHARTFCRSQHWQLLDQTVTLAGLWPTRSKRGLQWRRRYRFDFSPDGGQRRGGELTMIGTRLIAIWAEREDGGRVIEEGEETR
ncbi:DUF3301 domain-containing protein [Wenzhouxiangella sp. AB-CW3]|uniref:DUF3301 domain-containing protein n=1 Tax=Wenzhouxiangella sp. AB-CW3 TaxID=2771012 RepID=UPI00168A9E00|nr:DUF3301 domain-containing protein [Wenzhouxiangella sp. AB-CW3]QOC23673.1 DUF3301 domain-containing protein [Wenzhouxiangella sp. AB-CW3]